MKTKSAIFDRIHTFYVSEYTIKETLDANQIFVVQQNNENKNMYFLKKKAKEFNSNNMYSFINRCEKSFELIHPSILNISGFSVSKPYIYYKYIMNSHCINDIDLNDDNIQKIFIGIASGLSYLLSKGYYYSDFSISSIILDKNDSPKLLDYINFEESEKDYENDLIPKYADILSYIIKMKKDDEPELQINDELQNLIKRSKQKMNLPTFKDYIQFFRTKNYRKDINIIKNLPFMRYLEILEYSDKIVYDENISKSKFFNSEGNPKFSSIEEILYYFYHNRKKFSDKIFIEQRFLLNLLPEYYIKRFANFVDHLMKSLQKYTYYEDLSLVFPDFINLFEFFNKSNPFKIYREIIKKIKSLENQINDAMYLYNKRKLLENQVDALRIQAIHYLKKAYKHSSDVKIKIELAVQYINGSLLPYNLNKALDILNKIEGADKTTQELIDKMKYKIENVIQTTSKEKILPNLPEKQKEILEKAWNEEDILSMLYCGLSFYTGFNGFPIHRTLSIEFYRKASKKSTQAMTLLGQLYFKGVIFPQNFKRAKNCFLRAAECGDIKAEIIDCLLRRHLWRSYMVDFDVDYIINHYLPSFKSILNDVLVIPRINYFINDNVYDTHLEKEENYLHSERSNENYSMIIKSEKEKAAYYLDNPAFSELILIPDVDCTNTKDSMKQLLYAKNYFYGINGFPVDYKMAAEIFKWAADNGNSEAQWRYAMMCYNSLGTKNSYGNAEFYFLRSSIQEDLRGKLLYALYLRDRGDNFIFEQHIQQCCSKDNIDAMYYFAMHLEGDKSSHDRSMFYYSQAANKGHIDSLVRLLYFLKYRSQDILYEDYFNLSVGILNVSFLIKRILYYDRKKEFEQSNILIQIGLKLNYRLFNAFYADHLLYGKGMKSDEKRAEKFVFLAYNDKYPSEYWERYIYIMLEIFIRRKQHQEAAEFLLNHKDSITERFRRKFLFFYRKFDKNVAQNNFITVNFCDKNYQKCVSCLMELKNNINIVKVINDLQELAIENENPYAMSILGSIYKKGKQVVRDLKKAVKFFALSAQKKCPEGYYYFGKECYFGRILNQDFDLAEKYFRKAMDNYGEPRAGYYLYEMRNKCKKKDDLVKLLNVSASFGYRRALYKYGHRLITGKDGIKKDETLGKKLILQASLQNYKKAKIYCKKHSITDIDLDFGQDSIDIIRIFGNTKITMPNSINGNEIFGYIDSDIDDENIDEVIDNIKSKKKLQNENDKEETKNSEQNDISREKILDLINMLEEKKSSPKFTSIEDEKSSEFVNDKKGSNLFKSKKIKDEMNSNNNSNDEKSYYLEEKKSSNKDKLNSNDDSSFNLDIFMDNKKISMNYFDEKDEKSSEINNNNDSKISSLSSTNRIKKSTHGINIKGDKATSNLNSSKNDIKVLQKEQLMHSDLNNDDDTTNSNLSHIKKDEYNSKKKSGKDKAKSNLNINEEDDDISDLIAFWY